MEALINFIKRLIPKKLFKALQPPYHFLLSWLAALVYRFPSERIVVVGVTGTTGKTSSVYLMAKTLEGLGYKVGYTSTAMFNDGKYEWLNDKKMTMVGRFFTQKMLSTMVRNGCRIAIIETTSEGVKQYRHRFINYDYLLFTNLYEEHIESHGSFEKYKEAKGRLFAHLSQCKEKCLDENKRVLKLDSPIKKIDKDWVRKTIIANGDDGHAEYFLSFKAEDKIVYTQDNGQTWPENYRVIRYGHVQGSARGVDFRVEGTAFKLGLLGDFNAGNAMNAVALAGALGHSYKDISLSLSRVGCIAGRLEAINEGQDFTVIVDYAFEPKALANLYNTLDYIPHKRIINVLGATGGGRDQARQPVLGRLAGEKADMVIVTNEDPYDDDPLTIIKRVAAGAETAGKKIDQDLFIVINRQEAIEKAVKSAAAGDIVLITGKGSEQAICVEAGRRLPWDDRAQARAALHKLIDRQTVDKKDLT